MIAFLLFGLAASAPTVLPAPAADAAPTAVFGSEATLDAADLERATAREDLSQVAIANQTAQVANSSVNGTSTTGAVTMSGNAFQGSSGLTIVNANSGNNVAINAALNVNITFAPQ